MQPDPRNQGVAVYKRSGDAAHTVNPAQVLGVAKLPADEMTYRGSSRRTLWQTVRQRGASERRNGLRNHADVLFAALLTAEELVLANCLNCSAAA